MPGEAPIEAPAAPTEAATATSAPPATEPPASEPVEAQPAAAATPAASPTPEPAQPRQIVLAQVAEARRPVYLTHAGDGSGRLFVVEKPGTIRILAGDALSETPFLDIRDRVNADGSEQGLLGLAFPPGFAETGFFFVNYTDARGDTVISRFSVGSDPNAADPASEFVVLRLDQPAQNHNGGHLLFGPDGHLWIGTGDGGAANDRFGNGQNPDTLLGKMLRLDVTSDPAQPYVIPADNPWIQAGWNGKDVRDEIWGVGLRNPWRYSFDRATGDLWIADVGQNVYEEVHFVPAGSPGGLNFGWPIMEGTHCFPDSAECDRTGLEIPVADYAHQGQCSVTGGYVYRGGALPELAGAYVYGDFCSGEIWALTPQDGGWQNRLLVDTDAAISSFGEDAAGELYVLDLDGAVFRLAAQ
jgi:glucose/arabinose dehydrogenase